MSTLKVLRKENEQMKAEIITYCQECNTNPGKSKRFIDIPVCDECEKLPKYTFITKTDAKNEYLVKDEDLNTLEYYQVNTGYGRGKFANLFNKLEVMIKACERHSTNMDELEQVLQQKLQDKRNKSNIRKARADAKKAKIQEEINARQEPRRNEIIHALRAAGLELRNDSKLCQMYINGERNDLEYIVRRMGEMRYLYEYCHMNECFNEAYEKIKEERNIFGYCDKNIQEIAERIALKKYSNGRYPTVFPWQN